MRKMALCGLMAVFVSSAFAESNTFQDLTAMQNHYYEKGYKEASRIFYRLGYEKAIKNSIKALEKYKTQIDAYEAGKYYANSGKLTYPQMYRIKDGDNYVIRIEKPELKERMSYSDILMIPEYDEGMLADTESGALRNLGENEMNAFNPITPVQNVNSAISEVRKFEVEFPKTDKNKQIFTNMGKPYTATPESYKVTFGDKNDFETFCKSVSGDVKCKRLMQEQ